MIIDIRRMIDESLSINDCLFLYFCRTKNMQDYNYYREQFGAFATRDSVINLVNKGYLEFKDPTDIKINFSNLELTQRAKFILQDIPVKQAEEVATNKLDWMEEWYALFPKGLKSGGYPVRSGLGGCRNKMFKFLRKNKFTKETIINATKLYLKEMEKVNYSFMSLAHYFIEKDGKSILEAYCEQILDMENKGEDVNIELNKGYTDSFNTSLN